MKAKDKERIRLLSLYGNLYAPYSFERNENSFGCFYCGDIGSAVDHCPPLAAIETRQQKFWHDDGIKFVKLPTCSACNARLSSKPLFTPLLRAQEIEQWLICKYETQAALWSEDEIQEMSPAFQKTIRARKEKHRILLERVRHAQWRVMAEFEALEGVEA